MRFDTHPAPAPASGYVNGCIRRYPRALFSVPVTLRHLTPGGIGTSCGISLDIGESGFGALVKGALRWGKQWRSTFNCQSGRSVPSPLSATPAERARDSSFWG